MKYRKTKSKRSMFSGFRWASAVMRKRMNSQERGVRSRPAVERWQCVWRWQTLKTHSHSSPGAGDGGILVSPSAETPAAPAAHIGLFIRLLTQPCINACVCLHWFLTAAVTNTHTLSGLKWHRLFTSQAWMSEVWNGSQWAKTQALVGLHPFQRLQRRGEENPFLCLFRFLEDTRIPELAAPSSVFRAHPFIFASFLMSFFHIWPSSTLWPHKGPGDYVGPAQIVQEMIFFLNIFDFITWHLVPFAVWGNTFIGFWD